MTANDVVGQVDCAADFAHFVFKELAQGLDQLKPQIFRQAADVVMAFDFHGDALSGLRIDIGVGRFDHIGVKGALGKIVKGAKPGGFFFKDADEFVADDFALFFGVGDALDLG